MEIKSNSNYLSAGLLFGVLMGIFMGLFLLIPTGDMAIALITFLLTGLIGGGLFGLLLSLVGKRTSDMARQSASKIRDVICYGIGNHCPLGKKVVSGYVILTRDTLCFQEVKAMGGDAAPVVIPLRSIQSVSRHNRELSVVTTNGSHYFTFVPAEQWQEQIERASGLRLRASAASAAAPSSSGTAEELVKYKQLLDSGVISQEEYNDIKKKLLQI